MDIQRQSPIELCPPEVWTQILDIACLDEGFTARSLSEVSRRIRVASAGYLYSSLKIESIPQLLKLEEQLLGPEDGGVPNTSLETRFLCIVLPTTILNIETRLAELGDDEISEYDPDGSETASTSSSKDSNASALYDAKSLEEQEAAELALEVVGLREDLQKDPWYTISGYTDLVDSWPHLMDQHLCRVYKAIRRLLEACSTALEVLTLYHYPGPHLPHDMYMPRLPRLRHLSIGFPPSNRTYLKMTRNLQPDYRTSPLFPSLRVLHLASKNFSIDWLIHLIKTIPNSADVAIVGDMITRRYWMAFSSNSEEPQQHTWKLILPSPSTEDVLLDFMRAVWLENIGGAIVDGGDEYIKLLDRIDDYVEVEDATKVTYDDAPNRDDVFRWSTNIGFVVSSSAHYQAAHTQGRPLTSDGYSR